MAEDNLRVPVPSITAEAAFTSSLGFKLTTQWLSKCPHFPLSNLREGWFLAHLLFWLWFWHCSLQEPPIPVFSAISLLDLPFILLSALFFNCESSLLWSCPWIPGEGGNSKRQRKTYCVMLGQGKETSFPQTCHTFLKYINWQTSDILIYHIS